MTTAGTPATRSRAAGTGLSLAVLSAATFSTSGTFASALIGAGWSPAAAVTARIAVSALMLTVPALLQLRGRWPLLRRSAGRVTAYGLVAVAGCQLFYFSAIQRIPVGVALLLEYLGTVLVVGWLWLRHGQRPRRLTVAGLRAYGRCFCRGPFVRLSATHGPGMRLMDKFPVRWRFLPRVTGLRLGRGTVFTPKSVRRSSGLDILITFPGLRRSHLFGMMPFIDSHMRTFKFQNSLFLKFSEKPRNSFARDTDHLADFFLCQRKLQLDSAFCCFAAFGHPQLEEVG